MRPTARLAATFAALTLSAASAVLAADELPADQRSAIERVSADSLRAHLSFLSSDLLEGRGTPSLGLDVAAEYIASQFRRDGLEPVGDDGYFQTANWTLFQPHTSSFAFTLNGPDGPPLTLGADKVSFTRINGLDVKADGVYKLESVDSKLDEVKPGDVAGKVVVVTLPSTPIRDRASGLKFTAFMRKLGELKAAAIVNLGPVTGPVPPGRLFDPAVDASEQAARAERPGPPIFTVLDAAAIGRLKALPTGASAGVSVTIHLGPPADRPVKVRNVVGLLRGSDPVLKETYVLVTAHYDHIGKQPAVASKPDVIYNGANDDGSGAISVVEIASALSSLKTRPKRSVLFVTFFGEELGLLGSRYYGRHPVVPVEKTVADVNLEQVGRTDDTEGARVGAAVMTGHGYSEVSAVFDEAGRAEGIKIVRHPQFSDAYFARSDNQALADLGVPAHTLAVAFEFPDYHGLGDHWDKVDYANMARIDRMVARGLLMIADNPAEPKWNESNPKAAKYLRAWKARHSK